MSIIIITEKAFLVLISFMVAIILLNQIGSNNYVPLFVYAMENEELISVEITNNYVQISTQTDNNDERITEGLCNKLLESCPVPNTESNKDVQKSTTGPDNAEDISKKYFEHPDQKTPASPPTNLQSGQNTTLPFGSFGQPYLLNQSNVTQAETGFDNLTQSGNFTQAETGFDNLTQSGNFTQAETGFDNLTQSGNFTQAETGFDNLTQSGNFTQAETGFETYENPILGFSILYPSGWEKIENNTERYSVTTLLSPEESTEDHVRERLVLRINNFPTNFTLDDYSMRVKDTLEKNTNFNMLDFNSTFLSSNPAYGVTGIENQGGQNVDVIDKWTIKDGIVYRIAFYSENAKSDTYLPIGEKMIDSFSFAQ